MPELPEVETIKNTLKRFLLNKTIENVSVYWSNIIKLPDDIEKFKFMLTGQTFQNITRKGKFLLFHLDDYMLISHLRMEGKYSIDDASTPIKKHTHVIFSLNNNEELRYNDVRKFGTMHVVNKGEELLNKPLNQLGPDPFDKDFTLTYFYEKLNKTDRFIKTVLLDQSIVTGLGNIYVDETLFKAGVHPLKKASRLSKKEIKGIQDQAILTLKEAVEQGGTTIKSYVNGQGEMGMFQQKLFVYGQENEPCKNCGRPIVKMKVGGRGTHVCIACQKQ
ncbi:DNA-formamidopyrimidine glycosylase [Virgibacillus alimentarius]|uniref:Formamidopyrimidine-DNA glycosylase n=1 Tax=Virgibacillus alimentarius TaxID=698769 RepID=A0ABS4SAP1_9BACI|nr:MULTISPECIES: DNA-formamidopyrimidine glycosylase [Virgibacillus]MBP2258573.1 formamidopyrimidine-DNA glycosylase [Virgibacillus alimentarius]HLR68434.1 DNA-formamidopyrimidine glycosylase [Virgibacillus sp.]